MQSGMKQEINADDRKRVVDMIEYYFPNFPQDQLQRISNDLEQDNDVVVSKYLDPILSPLIPELHKKRATENGKNRYEYFLYMCFRGELSVDVLEKMWAVMDVGGSRVECMYSLMNSYPLAIAVGSNNMPALQFLIRIYESELIPNHSFTAHLNAQLIPVLNTASQVDQLKLLLDMCVRNSVPDYSSDNDYSKNEMQCQNVVNHSGTIEKKSLFDVFADLCIAKFEHTDFFFNPLRKQLANAVLSYVYLNGIKENFEQFREILKNKLKALDEQAKAERYPTREYQSKIDYVDAFDPDVHCAYEMLTPFMKPEGVNYQELHEIDAVKILMWSYSCYDVEDFVSKLTGTGFKEKLIHCGDRIYYKTINGVKYEFLTYSHKEMHLIQTGQIKDPGLYENAEAMIYLNGGTNGFHHSKLCAEKIHRHRETKPDEVFESINKKFSKEQIVSSESESSDNEMRYYEVSNNTNCNNNNNSINHNAMTANPDQHHKLFANSLIVNNLAKVYPAYEALYKKSDNHINNVLAFFQNYCETRTWSHTHINTVKECIADFKKYNLHNITDFLLLLKMGLLKDCLPLKSIADGGSLAKRIDFIQKKYNLNKIDVDSLCYELSGKKLGNGKK